VLLNAFEDRAESEGFLSADEGTISRDLSELFLALGEAAASAPITRMERSRAPEEACGKPIDSGFKLLVRREPRPPHP